METGIPRVHMGNTLASGGLEEPFFLVVLYVMSVFGSGGKKVLVQICMYYLEYNNVVVVR